MKGSIACMLVAAKKFVSKYPNHNNFFSFIITSDEEGTGKDGTIKIIKYLLSKKEKIDYCIVGEPSSEFIIGDTIKNGRRGSLNIILKIKGVQGHIAYPNLAKNPIHLSIPFLHKLISHVWEKNNTLFTNTELQISNVNSDNDVFNIIPNYCKIKFNIRFSKNLSKKKIKKIIIKFLDYFKLNYELKIYLSSEPFLTKKNNLTKIVSNVIKKCQNIYPRISTNGGTSDGRFVSNLMSSEVIELGLINKNIHKINECVKIKDLKKLCILYYEIIKKICY